MLADLGPRAGSAPRGERGDVDPAPESRQVGHAGPRRERRPRAVAGQHVGAERSGGRRYALRKPWRRGPAAAAASDKRPDALVLVGRRRQPGGEGPTAERVGARARDQSRFERGERLKWRDRRRGEDFLARVGERRERRGAVARLLFFLVARGVGLAGEALAHRPREELRRVGRARREGQEAAATEGVDRRHLEPLDERRLRGGQRRHDGRMVVVATVEGEAQLARQVLVRETARLLDSPARGLDVDAGAHQCKRVARGELRQRVHVLCRDLLLLPRQLKVSDEVHRQDVEAVHCGPARRVGGEIPRRRREHRGRAHRALGRGLLGLELSLEFGLALVDELPHGLLARGLRVAPGLARELDHAADRVLVHRDAERAGRGRAALRGEPIQEGDELDVLEVLRFGSISVEALQDVAEA